MLKIEGLKKKCSLKKCVNNSLDLDASPVEDPDK